MSEMDQNIFKSKQWGELNFFPAKTNRVKDTCRHCLLRVATSARLHHVLLINGKITGKAIFRHIKCLNYDNRKNLPPF